MSLVMVVEDEQVLRDSMVRSLRRLPGITVCEASRYADARRLVNEERPALLVSDLSLPDTSGIGLLADLDAARLPIPVVFVTAYLGRYRDQIPSRKGIEVYEKPLPMNTLREVVLQQLESSRERIRPPFSLPDYLQMAALGRHSVLVRMAKDGVCQGWVRVVDGQLWSARCGVLRGEAAVHGITLLTAGQVEVENLDGPPGPREIQASVEAVLLEGLRRFDEAQRDERMVDDLLADLVEMPAASYTPAPLAVAPPPEDYVVPFERGQSDSERFNRLVEQGREAIFLGDHHGALLAFEQAAAIDPDHEGVRASLRRLARLYEPV